ncbi:MAG: hypothetical protein IGS48_19885 [Oscillatoriales cyanobacterium C42_A2020_001]|nr:hypothetical protein [Leptolyngbyaceae cyanobacterium C42_A2020_001]
MHPSVQIHDLFLKLQARYPTSSLLTELVQVHEGLFVVRALVQVGGTTIATGIAAAASVELAEDQARVRVLSLLGIVADGVEPASIQPIALTNGNGLTSKPAIANNPWLDSAPLETPLPVSPFIPPKELIDDAPTFDVEDEEAPEPEYFHDTETFVVDSAPDLPEPEPISPNPRSLKPTTTAKPQKPSQSEKETPSPTKETDDLSSLIAMTDVEMDRIGWTKQEGREYLKRTYGKSTRQRLDEAELMDFLNYLRALPSLSGL